MLPAYIYVIVVLHILKAHTWLKTVQIINLPYPGWLGQLHCLSHSLPENWKYVI